VKVKIPAAIRSLAEGHNTLEFGTVATLEDLIGTLAAQYPALAERLVDEQGDLRRFVNIYVDGEDVRFLDDVHTPLAPTSVVSILPAVSGGAAPGGSA
jgi:sulfur-carrier protein